MLNFGNEIDIHGVMTFHSKTFHFKTFHFKTFHRQDISKLTKS